MYAKINEELATKIEPKGMKGDEAIPDSFCLVIFGGRGDLSKRKLLPTIYHLYQEQRLPGNFSVIAVGHQKLDSTGYRLFVDEALNEFSSESYSSESCADFCSHISFISAEFEDSSKYRELRTRIDEQMRQNGRGSFNVIYYMAVPPRFFPTIVENISGAGLNRELYDPRIIIEKPFGHDKKSAIELNSVLSAAFSENRIYRIDHYLGKETVQNIIFFRFSNSIFEPLWNRRYIDNVQITVSESIGIGNRGAFYEKAGVIRDIIQNHMMQLIALIAMEPPIGFAPDRIRDEKVKVFRSLRPMSEAEIREHTVKGQYGPGLVDAEEVPAYRSEERVAADSLTPTFFAARVMIDNWRWAGVPFYVRSGKRLPKRLTEIVIQFKQPPLGLFGNGGSHLEPSCLILTIQPQEAITLRFGVKYPNKSNLIEPVNMNFCYNDAFHKRSYPAYSRLLLDCIRGDFTLFVRQDGVEAMWEFIDPIIGEWASTKATELPTYDAGSWGPDESQVLLEKDGRKWLTDLGVYCDEKCNCS